ncbi:hypothetical protein AHAS_Ahas09G0092400 [Arachis hypogaea]
MTNKLIIMTNLFSIFFLVSAISIAVTERVRICGEKWLMKTDCNNYDFCREKCFGLHPGPMSWWRCIDSFNCVCQYYC